MDKIDLAFTLDESMRPVDGRLTFDGEGVITVRENGERTRSLSAKDAKEAQVLGGVGCALILLTYENAPDIALARFDMSRLKAAGEWCKIVNHAIETGKPAFDDAIEPEVCEKCGKTLPEGMRVCPFCFSKTGLLKRVWSLMKPFRREAIISEAFIALSGVIYLSVPVLNRVLIDNYLAPRLGTAAQIMLLAGFMFLARAIGEVIFVLSSRVYARVGTLFSNHLRDLAYAKIQKLSMTALGRRTPGELIRRVMEDTVTIKDFLTDYGRWMVDMGLMFIASMVILALTNWRLTLLVFAPIPIVVVALYRFRSMIHIRYERQWRKNSRAQSILHDIIKGIRTVKSFGAEDREIAKFAGVSKDLAQVMTNNETMWALLFPAVTFFSGIGEFMVLYIGGKWILGGSLSLGVLVQFTMFLGYIYQPLRWLVSFPRMLADAMTSLVKMFEILDEEADIQETALSKDADVSGGVDYQSVSFGYKSYEPVLKEVSFTIEPGEMIGIVGKSGAGKSTLINLMLRLYDPNTGRITLSGEDLRAVSPRLLHEKAGVVFQDTFLFAGTIYDNILYAKPDATAAEVIAACVAANAHDFIMKSADGYDTLIGESGYSLSGGERQRLAIARAIIKHPRLLILDEATSSLDLETESIIQDSLNNLTRKRTTIAIAHRLSTLRAANRLIVLDKGRIAEMGDHMQLLRRKGIYYKLVMAQRQTNKAAG
ncbi:MAG: ABC transporter ATP-binding protein/permease [Oscillospiraceae bacterium]|jgi:ATP-binding cassette subfamily B protein|nr:ABC transporter ATP-binding protein/permease [Oscillospiraceae bacterium]